MRFNSFALLVGTLAGLVAAKPMPDSGPSAPAGIAARDVLSPAADELLSHARRQSHVEVERNYFSMSVRVAVAKCDTLTSIARKYASGVCDIFRANPGVIKDPNYIKVGDVISVPVNVPHPDDTTCLPPPPAPFIPPAGAKLNPDGSLNYTVIAGDTLTVIAGKFNSGICNIARRNKLPDPNLIDVKQVLAIPLNVENPDNTSCLPACVPDIVTPACPSTGTRRRLTKRCDNPEGCPGE